MKNLISLGASVAIGALTVPTVVSALRQGGAAQAAPTGLIDVAKQALDVGGAANVVVDPTADPATAIAAHDETERTARLGLAAGVVAGVALMALLHGVTR